MIDTAANKRKSIAFGDEDNDLLMEMSFSQMDPIQNTTPKSKSTMQDTYRRTQTVAPTSIQPQNMPLKQH